MDAPSRSQRAASIALVTTGLLAAAKLGVGVATGSLAVLSQALDSLLDLVALSLVLVAVRLAAKPADETHHYGHAKAENLVAFGQTVFLFVLAGGVVWEALTRLGEARPVGSPWYALALLAGSAAIDAGRAAWLTAQARATRSEALRAGALNLATDVITATLAVVSLVAESRGVRSADAAGALAIALLVIAAAARLGKRSADVLMDRAPGAPVAAIERAAARAAGVAETRRVRVRGTSDNLFADVTVAAGRTSSLERAHDIAESVEREIERDFPGADVVVHVEPVSETSGLVERVQAHASRVPGVHEVHNVLVHAFEEHGTSKLHVTLHAKVDPNVSLHEAHGVADAIEREVVQGLDLPARVDSHIEPLSLTASGRDVTESRADIVTSVQQAALQEPDVLDCHEVIVTSSDTGLVVVAHVSGRGTLPLTRMHDASERIERAVVLEHPDISSVLLHFEPA